MRDDTMMRTEKMSECGERDVVQVKSPRTGYYIKINRGSGTVESHKKSEGPYKGVPLARGKGERGKGEVAGKG